MDREQMYVSIVGHVDHGKSTVIGRLMADTNALPKGKLEAVKEKCKRESKVFEYAFLLDALKDEQSQGITIDSARCFFKTNKRDYLILDAPGHIEFLKNMVTGAARAEGGLLVIDAEDGVRENSRRHGYLLSLLGISQVVVLVNKMDLVGYKKSVFQKIKKEYTGFLKKIGVKPMDVIPVSALKGDNIAGHSKNLEWWKGNTVLAALDLFSKQKPLVEKPLRAYVQDVYKFTQGEDKRRIVAGRVEAGRLEKGDSVVFLPSGKTSRVKSIEAFSAADRKKSRAGYPFGVTLEEQVYIGRGQVMCREGERLPFVSSLLRGNVFWMGKKPLEKGKEYLLKIGTAKARAKARRILGVLDSSSRKQGEKGKVELHDAAECELELVSPIAYDLASDIPATGRFVVVDGYDIVGGGIITGYVEDRHADTREQVFLREGKWDHSVIPPRKRALRYSQSPKLVLITGATGVDKKSIAKALEETLFGQGQKPYFLGIGNLLRGLDADIEKKKREEHIRRLGEVAHILMDAGLIVIATASDLNDEELKMLQAITFKDEMLIIRVGAGGISDYLVDLGLGQGNVEENVSRVMELLKFKNVVFGL